MTLTFQAGSTWCTGRAERSAASRRTRAPCWRCAGTTTAPVCSPAARTAPSKSVASSWLQRNTKKKRDGFEVLIFQHKKWTRCQRRCGRGAACCAGRRRVATAPCAAAPGRRRRRRRPSAPAATSASAPSAPVRPRATSSGAPTTASSWRWPGPPGTEGRDSFFGFVCLFFCSPTAWP